MTRKENQRMWPTSCHVYLALVRVTAPAILPRATSPFLLPGPLHALLSESPKAEELQAWKDMALCFTCRSKMPSWPQQRSTFERK